MLSSTRRICLTNPPLDGSDGASERPGFFVSKPPDGRSLLVGPVLVIEAEGFLLAAWFLTGGRYW